MAQIVHEKNKKWIKEFLTPNLIANQKLTRKNSNELIEVKSIEIKEMSLEVAFMLTTCYFVKITLHIKDSSGHNQRIDEKEFKLVVKISPETDPERYKMLSMHDMFSNEIIAYEFVIPKLKYLSYSPKYYYSHNKDMDAAIVLSDFTTDGWRMSKSKVNLSIDHILVAVKELGRFHGHMYALKLTDTDTFNSLKDKLIETRYKKGGCTSPEWNLFLELGIRRATGSVRASKIAREIVPESFLKGLEGILYGGYNYRRRCLQAKEPIAIICHGDYLRNNIAFRYDTDGKAKEAMMFDFQTLCYSSPMIDLTTFIANSTGYEVRDKHFWNIFGTYHESLIINFLEATKWTANKVPKFLRYDNILKEYTRYLPFGLAVATTFLGILNRSGEPEFNEDSVEATIREIFDEGGEKVNVELCALVIDIYRLHEKCNLTLDKM